MARPTTKATEPIWRSLKTKGTYRVTYRAKSGNNPAGIPLASDTDLLNLEKVGGSTKAPPFIVTSEADFRASFVCTDTITADTPEGTKD